MDDSTSHHNLSSFFAGYCHLRECEEFFAAYHELVRPGGRLPAQNFLIGSALLREREVHWCQVLRWLLDVKACPRLAGHFLRCLCRKWSTVSIKPDELLDVRCEERSGDDRFDITLSNRRHQIIIEAKVNAVYDVDQHDRYTAKLEPKGCGIYLTRKEPNVPGRDSRWQYCTWAQVAALLKKCIDETREELNRFDENRWHIIAQDFVDFILGHGNT